MATTIKDVTIRFNTETKALLESEKLFDKVNEKIKEQQGALNKLKVQEEELRRLRNASTDPKAIDTYNKEIERTIAQQKKLNTTTAETSKGLNTFNDGLKKIGTSIALAFSVDAIISFGKESIKAFQEAELNANKLKFAIKNISGETEGAFNKLIKQSAELQENSIFSDDSIQQAQTMLAQYGLASDQIEALIPKIIDLASANGDDLATATDKVVGAINGQTKGLKDAGLQFEDTGDKTKNFNTILQSLDKFAGSAAVSLGSAAGQAKLMENRIDDLKESIGEKLLPIEHFLLETTEELLNAFTEVGRATNVLSGYWGLAAKDAEILAKTGFKPLTESATAAGLQLLGTVKGLDAMIDSAKRGKSTVEQLSAAIKFQSEQQTKVNLGTQEGRIEYKKRSDAIKELTLLIEKQGKAERDLGLNVKGQNDKDAADEKAQKDEDSRRENALKKIEEFEKKKKDFYDYIAIQMDKDKQYTNEQFEKEEQESLDRLNKINQSERKKGEKAADKEIKKIEKERKQELDDLEKFHGMQLDAEKNFQLAKQDAIAGTFTALRLLAGENADLQNTLLIFEKGIAIADVLLKAQAAVSIATSEASALSIPTAGASMLALPGLIATIEGAAALSTASIIATAIPQFKFAKGVIDFKGKGTGTSDSNLAAISHGESVMTAEETKQHKPIFNAIRNNELEKHLNESYVRPKLELALNNIGFNKSISDSIRLNQLDEYGVSRALKKGTTIRNVDEIASAIARKQATSSSEYKLLKRRGII